MSNLSGFVKKIRNIMRNDPGVNGDAQRIEQIAWILFLKVYDAKEADWEIAETDFTSVIPENCRWRNWASAPDGKGLTGDDLLSFVNNTLFPSLKALPAGTSVPLKKAIVQATFADANNYMKDGYLLRQILGVIDDLDLSDYSEIHAFGEIYESILKELQSAGSSGEFYTPRAVTDFIAKIIRPKIGEKMADFACGTGGFLTGWLSQLKGQIKTTADRKKFSASIFGIEKKQFPYMLCVTNMLLHDIDAPEIFHDNALTQKNLLDYTEKDRFDVVLMNPPYGGAESSSVKHYFPADLAGSETADLFMSVIMFRLKKNGRAAVILPDGFLFGTDNTKVAIKKKLLNEFNLHTIIRLPGSVFAPYTSITTNILFFDRSRPTSETWFYRLDMPDGFKHFSKTKPMRSEHFDPVIQWWDKRTEIFENGFDKAKKFSAAQLAEELNFNFDQCGFPHTEEEILPPHKLIAKYQKQRATLNADIDKTLARIEKLLGNNR